MPSPRSLLPLALAVATGAGGYLVGARSYRPAPAEDAVGAENERLKALVAALERDLAARPLPLAAGGDAASADRPAGASAGGPRVAVAGSRSPGEDVPFPAVTEGLSQDEFVRQCFAFLEAQLARGPEGHLAILQAIDQHLVKGKEIQRMFASEEDAVRVLYPLLRFAVQHEGQVVDLMATTFRTMAETPQTLAELDGGTLEMFTEGLALALPGAVSPERLATFAGWVGKVLDTPNGSQPTAIEQNRRELAKLLTVWAPPLTVEQAVEALAQVETLPAERIASIVRRLPPEARARIDAVAVLGPLIDAGNWFAIRLLREMQVGPGDLAMLDRRELEALNRGAGLHPPAYLEATGRAAFEKARGFYDAWGALPDLQADAYAYAVLNTEAPVAYVRDVVARTKLSDRARTFVQARIEAMERTAAGPR